MANTKGTSVINNPKSGGAQSGLGEKFSPDLFTGTGNFSVPIAVPPGRNGFQPELTLGYSSGNGNGIFGMGWAIGIPGVTRKTSKRIPIYEDKSDIFILSGAEDLVPIKIETEVIVNVSGKIGYERTFYRPRTEGLFARIIRHKKTNGEHYWEVCSKDGLISYYGTPGAASGDSCVIANPEKRDSIFAWHLSKTIDPFGNVILYEYERDLVLSTTSNSGSATSSGAYSNKGRSYDQVYLKTIKYCQYTISPNPVAYLCEVKFNYEERPDPFSGYKQGFEVRTMKRCSNIETYTNAAALIKTKTYHFNYVEELPLNGASLLASVSVEGHNATESEWMPPLEFAYSVFDPKKRDLREIKGPIPPMSLADPGFELVDLDGNGLPDLLQLNGVARYWTNKGNGEFSPPKNLSISPSVQLGTPGVRFMDANGDGRNDLLVNNGIVAGYFPGSFHSVWDNKSFIPYKKIPSFSFADPEVQLIDLDGDGITDVLRNGKRFECFYNDGQKGFYKVRTADKKFTDFSFSDPRIRFADMTGDGLQDIVLISSGRVQYWPNMGYGRFGNKINMTNAPVFPEQYNPNQILLGDIDGDGQADIAFLGINGITLYVNQSGNSFSDGVKVYNTPRIENLQGTRIIDLLGNGQAGILWSFIASVGTAGKMFFLDLTKGNKPYVLEEMNNNMGSLTRVKYGSSVEHYLRDQLKPTTRWKTDLPFPVQVVNRVEVLDLLSRGKLVTEYNYHNGYWDGVEREFRGFAHVDTKDTESFDRFNKQDLFAGEDVNTVSVEHYSAPTMTKSWFYVGPVGDGFSKWHEPDFSDEYWSGDQQVLERTNDMLSLLAGLPRRARRDALRTLRGSLLRSELYAIDGSPLQTTPYTVSESLMSLRLEFNPSLLPQPLWAETQGGYWAGGGYVFFPFNIAQRTTQYERGTDLMTSYSFTKQYDEYGQVLAQLSVALPRGSTVLGGGNGKYLASYSSTDYIYKNVTNGQYMVNRISRSIAYDATTGSVGKPVFKFRDEVFNNTATLITIGCTLNYYDGTEFVGENFGIIGAFGALIRSETLITTDTIISDAYTTTPQCFESTPDWSTGYPAAFAGDLQNADDRLGYKDRRSGYPNHEPGWYAESTRLKYDFQDAGMPIEEQLGRVLISRDVFDAWQEIEYDIYFTFPEKSKQYLYLYGGGGNHLLTEAAYDYRVMQPYQIKDQNENYSEFDFSPLGLLRATALIGKGTEGDYKSSSGGFYDRYAPSVIMEYDFFAFKSSGDPVWVKTISREKHYQQGAVSDTITKVEYSDGFGRLLQTRVQAEDVILGQISSGDQCTGNSGLPPDQSSPNDDAVGIERGISDPLNVVVSGWQIYNNKGKVVEKYEPYFDSGFDYTPPFDLALLLIGGGLFHKLRLYYDSLGRVVRTRNPDGTEQRVIYGIPTALSTPNDYAPTPWENYSYDANDLAPLANPGTNPVPSTQWYTPKSAEVDALGRTIKTTEHQAQDTGSGYEDVNMFYSYDIRGNLLLVKDPYHRHVFEHKYDLRPAQKDEQGNAQPLPPIWTNHIDKGQSNLLFDALAKPIESHDAKDAMTLSSYDVISRPENAWAKNDSSDTLRLRQYLIYGDSAGLTNPQNQNLKGKLYQNYDEAGLNEISEYDFKGNVLNKKRQVVDSATLKTDLDNYNSFLIDWTGLPAILDTFVFESDMEYDALNRVTKLTLPEDVSATRKEIIPTYNRAGALEQVSYDGTDYVKNIAYNAKGQRILIAFGNNVMTRYAYDNLSFRLLRQRSEKYTFSQSGSTVTYAYNSGTNKQDDGFNYDLVGNILKILNRVTDCGISGSALGSNALDREFEYDPLYRLTYADGRESDTQNQNTYLYDDAPAPGSPNANHVRAYSRTYSYDKLGNVQSVVQGGTNGFTRDFVYNTGQNTLQEINDSTPTLIEDFTYDNCGNQITAGSTRNYKWNHADLLYCYYNQASPADPTVFTQYDYDAAGKRLSKLVRTGTLGSPIYERTIYIDGIFEYVKLENGTTYEKNYVHVMDDQSRICEVRVNVGPAFPGDITDDVTYHLEDQIGSSVVRLSTTATVIDKEEYYPFGDSSLRTFTYKRYRYVGKERDQESGLYYYGARYYAAWTCRFISVDPLAQKYNWQSSYVHADNNPINRVDHNGMGTDGDGEPKNGGPNNNPNSARDNTAVKGKNIVITPEMEKDLKDKANGVSDSKKQGKDIQKMSEHSQELHSKEHLLQKYGNPDVEAGAAAKKTYDENKNPLVRVSILFNIFADPVLQAIGSGMQIAKGGSSNSNLTYKPGPKTDPSTGNKNVANSNTNNTTKPSSTLTAKPILNSFKDVIDFISNNGKLPPNFILKKDAVALGWKPKAGNLDKIAPGKSIGGDIFENTEGLLPNAKGRVWFEADINYFGGYRGDERLVYSNDGLYFITKDHYKSFKQIK